MKTMKFRKNLAEEILAGRKNSTWRLFDDKDFRVGDEVDLIIWESKEKFAKVEIVEVKIKKLGEIEKKDFDGHKKYESQKEILEELRKYYGEKVNLDTEVKIIRFKLLK